MKSYLTFSAEDFACDEDFFNWIKYPARYPELESFWRNWLRENTSKKEVIEEAKCLVLSMVQENQHLPSENTQEKVWRRIEATTRLPLSNRSPIWQEWYSWAAVILFMVSVGWFAFDLEKSGRLPAFTKNTAEYVKHVNNAGVPKTIILGDGTSIILQPQSVLEYPKTFKPDSREVHLNGQAFFEVTRDPDRPFLVQAGEIVTRVLGTSFTVRNFEGEDKVLVQVKTGKVSVFMASEKTQPSGDPERAIEGVVLMPNQQVIFERLEMKMTKSLVENPTVLIPVAKHEFEFVDAPIKDVFAAIEQAYGVDIVFDEEALSSCYLNASLTDVPLYEKLKLICRGINTTYEVIDSHIIIYGRGCNEEITNPNPI